MKFLKLIPILFIFFGIAPIKNEVQAEDGIRDTTWSRGLGDVYKRQYLSFAFHLVFSHQYL